MAFARPYLKHWTLYAGDNYGEAMDSYRAKCGAQEGPRCAVALRHLCS
jgi:hypothetical protein